MVIHEIFRSGGVFLKQLMQLCNGTEEPTSSQMDCTTGNFFVILLKFRLEIIGILIDLHNINKQFICSLKREFRSKKILPGILSKKFDRSEYLLHQI